MLVTGQVVHNHRILADRTYFVVLFLLAVEASAQHREIGPELAFILKIFAKVLLRKENVLNIIFDGFENLQSQKFLAKEIS